MARQTRSAPVDKAARPARREPARLRLVVPGEPAETAQSAPGAGQGVAIALVGLALVGAGLAGVEPDPRLFGGALVASGLVHLAAARRDRGTPLFWFSILSSGVALVAGATLLALPLPSTLSLALLLIFLLLYEATAAFAMALEAQDAGARWAWPAVLGGVDTALAALIVAGLIDPQSSTLLVLFGASQLLAGSTIASLGRRAEK